MEKTYYFQNTLDLPEISPQSAIFGFLLADKEAFQVKNLIVLLFKAYIYHSHTKRNSLDTRAAFSEFSEYASSSGVIVY